MIVVLPQFSNFSAISWREQVNFQRDDDEVRFVLDIHAELNYSASSLKQQSEGRHVSPLGHIILILSQPVFALCFLMLRAYRRSNKYQFDGLWFDRPGLEPTIYYT